MCRTSTFLLTKNPYFGWNRKALRRIFGPNKDEIIRMVKLT